MMCDFSTMASIAPRISARYDPTSSTPPSIATRSCMPDHAVASAIADHWTRPKATGRLVTRTRSTPGLGAAAERTLAGCRHPRGHEVTWVARLRCRAVASRRVQDLVQEAIPPGRHRPHDADAPAGLRAWRRECARRGLQ